MVLRRMCKVLQLGHGAQDVLLQHDKPRPCQRTLTLVLVLVLVLHVVQVLMQVRVLMLVLVPHVVLVLMQGVVLMLLLHVVLVQAQVLHVVLVLMQAQEVMDHVQLAAVQVLVLGKRRARVLLPPLLLPAAAFDGRKGAIETGMIPPHWARAVRAAPCRYWPRLMGRAV